MCILIKLCATGDEMRRDSRITALCMIFERFFVDEPYDEELLNEQKEKDKEFTNELVKEYSLHKEEIENLVEKYLVGYEKDRVYKIDLAVLSLALVEIFYCNTPAPIAINEAVEIAKAYSTENSAKFINGILSSIIKGEAK